MDKEYLRDELTKIKSKMDAVNCQVDPAHRRLAAAKANGPQEEIDEAERLVAALSLEFDELTNQAKALMDRAIAENPTGPLFPD